MLMHCKSCATNELRILGTAKDEADVEWDWEVLDYNEKRDVYVVQPGWYESVKNWDEYGLCGILDIVTHWMPLPEPPEEE